MSGSTKHTAWHPGLESDIPSRLLRQSTIFDPSNVSSPFEQTQALSDLTGLPSHRLSKFRLERLLIHELLIRVTCDLSVPDGPEYEALGLNLRGMVHCLFDGYFKSNLGDLVAAHEELLMLAEQKMRMLFAEEHVIQDVPPSEGLWGKVRSVFSSSPGLSTEQNVEPETLLRRKIQEAKNTKDPLEVACATAVQKIADAFFGKQGFLPRESSLVVDAALILFSNEFGARKLRDTIEADFQAAISNEGFVKLPRQDKPVVLNVKGASAAGKSTIRPQQRMLAERLGIPWEQFALVSPDYWRKYLLDYTSLGADYKYGAMLTGRELEVIDHKLDRYMAEKANRGEMPHLLIDRFRFDSFSPTDQIGSGSNLLSRFGDTIFLFFMITPPEETVERAWKRGITTGRYKAVDDLLFHNVEAYTGIPDLFLSWALSKKKVHWEFLDNDVPLGSSPRSVAFGWNDHMTIINLEKLLDIDRYTSIDIDATRKADLYANGDVINGENCKFMSDCVKRLSDITFIDPDTGKVDAIIKDNQASLLESATPKRRNVLQRLENLLERTDMEIIREKDLRPYHFVDADKGGELTLGTWIGNL